MTAIQEHRDEGLVRIQADGVVLEGNLLLPKNAAGVVVFSGFHPQYGYMVDIDHGNDLVTRYAHTSKILVREGDLVQRGRKIAEVGTTGRSTGPHLHFEVRFRGAAQNPTKFLVSNPQPSAVARAK